MRPRRSETARISRAVARRSVDLPQFVADVACCESFRDETDEQRGEAPAVSGGISMVQTGPLTKVNRCPIAEGPLSLPRGCERLAARQQTLAWDDLHEC